MYPLPPELERHFLDNPLDRIRYQQGAYARPQEFQGELDREFQQRRLDDLHRAEKEGLIPPQGSVSVDGLGFKTSPLLPSPDFGVSSSVAVTSYSPEANMHSNENLARESLSLVPGCLAWLCLLAGVLVCRNTLLSPEAFGRNLALVGLCVVGFWVLGTLSEEINKYK